jgi:hypothetical protein
MKSQQGRRNSHDYSNEHDRDQNGRFSSHPGHSSQTSNIGSRSGPNDDGQGYRNEGYYNDADRWNGQNYGYRDERRGDQNNWSENSGRGYYDDRTFGRGTYNRGYWNNNSEDYPRRDDRGRFSGAYNDDYARGDDWDRQSARRSHDYGDVINNSGTSQWMDRENERRQSHKGKGPKGYIRSDERITEDANQKLSDDHDVDASDIEVSVSNGEVTLSGTVDSRESKRKAEDLVEGVSGVLNVENRLRVENKKNERGDSSRSSVSGESGKERSKNRNHVTV